MFVVTMSSTLPDIQTLAAGLATVFKSNGYTSGQVAVLDRQPNPYSASHLSEIVTCQFDDDNQLRLFCKYGVRQLPLDQAREKLMMLRSDLGQYSGVMYEAAVYRHILQPLQLASLKMYGEYTDAITGQTWLILEYLDKNIPIEDLEDIPSQQNALGLAARWIGRFHAVNHARLVSEPILPLGRFDAAYYVRWARLTSLSAGRWYKCYPWLTVACRAYEELIDFLLTQPLTVIHGDYHSDNTLFCDGRIYPIDWGYAAIAVGELDLAMLTLNWPADYVRRCELEYQQARWPESPPAEFEKTLNMARLYLHLRLLSKELISVDDETLARSFRVIRSLAERMELI